MKRKLFSVLLTAALLLSATVPALADDDESASSANDTSSGAEFSVPASEEGPVEDNSSDEISDAPSVVEGFATDDGDDAVILAGVLEDADEETETEDEPETVGEAVTEDEPETVDETDTEDAPETVDETETEDAPETVGEPVTEDAPETVGEPVTEDAPETVEEPVATSDMKMLGEPVAADAPETVEAFATGAMMMVSAGPVLPDEDEEAEEDEDELFAVLFGESPVISVEVPNSGSIIVNPYRIKVTSAGEETQDAIVSEPIVLINRSQADLTVKASAIGWATSDASEVRFAGDEDNLRNKDLFVYYEFRNVSDAGGEAAWSGSYDGASNQLVVRNRSDAASPLSEVLTFPAADGDSPTYAALRAFGSASVPDKGRWKADDTVNIRLSFTFTPA